MRQEVAAILAPAGLATEWCPPGDSCVSETAALVIVKVHGSCRMDQIPLPTRKIGPLGWTHITDGDVLPFSGIDCDRVRDYIGRLASPAKPPEREAILGRALARVLAHELYHALARTEQHGKSGVAKRTHSALELLSAQFGFHPADCHRLRSALSGQHDTLEVHASSAADDGGAVRLRERRDHPGAAVFQPLGFHESGLDR